MRTPPKDEIPPAFAYELLAWCKANGRRLFVSDGRIKIEELATGWIKSYTTLQARRLMHGEADLGAITSTGITELAPGSSKKVLAPRKPRRGSGQPRIHEGPPKSPAARRREYLREVGRPEEPEYHFEKSLAPRRRAS